MREEERLSGLLNDFTSLFVPALPACTPLRSFQGRQIIWPMPQPLLMVFLLSQGDAQRFSSDGLLRCLRFCAGIQTPGLEAPVPSSYRKALSLQELRAVGLKELLSHVTPANDQALGHASAVRPSRMGHQRPSRSKHSESSGPSEDLPLNHSRPRFTVPKWHMGALLGVLFALRMQMRVRSTKAAAAFKSGQAHILELLRSWPLQVQEPPLIKGLSTPEGIVTCCRPGFSARAWRPSIILIRLRRLQEVLPGKPPEAPHSSS